VVYPVAIIKESKNIPTAEQVLQFLFTKEAQAVVQQNGFLPLDR
jgi:ABC-type molybdate transport system substrate-binding protein